eukprot:Trichotokara_eunicae@DN6082_c0_g1_i1.p1
MDKFSCGTYKQQFICGYLSAKFRMLTALYNPGKRPAYKISCLRFNTQYYHRGVNQPFGINEWKDLIYKLREQILIKQRPTIQYPAMHRQVNEVSTPSEFVYTTHE